MSSLYRQQLERWLGKITVKADSVLDVGGGQYPVKNRVLNWEVNHYAILDNDNQYSPDYCFDMNYPIEKKIKPFDVVFCLEVAEYIFDPITFHKNLSKLVKPKGILYISYPTIYPLHNPPNIDYLRYTKNAIKKLLKEAGFKNWKIEPRIATAGVNSLADFYSLEQMRAMKHTNDIFDLGYLVKAYK